MAYASLFKAETGSAVIAAHALRGSAHVHAIRYGDPKTKEYKRAFDQHIGRFLSLVRRKVAKSVDDEPRDNYGRWMRGIVARGVVPHGTRGLLGLDKAAAMKKITGILDGVMGHNPGERRAVTYPAKAAGWLAGSTGTPPDVAEALSDHVREATHFVVGKVLDHPQFKRIATKIVLNVKKAFEADPEENLKGLVAEVMANTKLNPHVSCSDEALAAVAHGAYGRLHNRLSALSAPN